MIASIRALVEHGDARDWRVGVESGARVGSSDLGRVGLGIGRIAFLPQGGGSSGRGLGPRVSRRYWSFALPPGARSLASVEMWAWTQWLFGVVVIGCRVGFVTAGLLAADRVNRCAR